ncbi:Rieske (2Fe-2S) protein [Halarchaeum nitratireducens]|uniref:(2Fe-2S) ferredoxin n=1 Tax=Halarchaeum nitratireducens TaxID=489913 RepID=A0A830G8E7_9EURY|nr:MULTISPECIES: Rieske 2Fe-2S domain-containing protein [Halarchaeum]MBP2250094.1 nitrite reductase/ring-hydroxylating ferredoxin subunit [Halarchaeum solikamskense]GGN08546.1 (2Fe-2S) ferredoxin [Halarchaeum nitratireducens]
MVDGTEIASLDDVPELGSYLFTAEDLFTNEEEVILVRCEDDPGVEAWVNNCPHESQRFDRGDGAPMRDGEIICPKHGSLFDRCTGECDNGEAAGTTLPSVDVAVDGETIYLTDDDYTFLHAGPMDDDEGPGSTSHLSF